jgi:arginine repressor
MEDPSFYERINRENLKKKTPERKVTLERLEHVARLIKENPFLTQNELTVELNKIEDLKYLKNGKRVDITRTTVARLLKVGKFKKKRVKCVPKERNTTKSLEKRYDYCSKYS